MYETIADFYDSEFRGWNEDLYFYLSFLNPEARVLELGSGAGRLAIPLAQKGHKVTGIEISAGMLETAANALKKLPFEIQQNVKFIRGDFSNLNLNEKFDAVIASFSALNLAADESAHLPLFKNLLSLLKPGGMLLADIVFEKPNPKTSASRSEKTFCHCERGTLIKKISSEILEAGHLLSVKQIYEEKDYLSGSLIDRRENNIKLYVFPPDEILKKLETAGFEAEEVFGDYQKTPFDRNKSARMLIAVKRPA